MPNQNIQINVPGESRGNQLKQMIMATTLWQEAQVRHSQLRGAVMHEDFGNAQERSYKTLEKEEYKEGQFGVQPTPLNPRTYTEIVTRPRLYEDSDTQDISDNVGSDRSVLSDGAGQLPAQKARLMDRLSLKAIINPVAVVNAGATDGSDNFISAYKTTDLRYKQVAYFHDGGAADAADLADGAKFNATSDVIDAAQHLFDLRDVTDELYCTLTPELNRLLS